MAKNVAVALRYDSTAPAPFLTAGARGRNAQRIVELAEQFGVPVHVNGRLAAELVELVPGTIIPEALYDPIAQLLAFVMDIEKRQAHTQ